MPPNILPYLHYVHVPSSTLEPKHINLPFKWFVYKGDVRLFSGVWSENAALFERLMEIHSNPPILHVCILWL